MLINHIKKILTLIILHFYWLNGIVKKIDSKDLTLNTLNYQNLPLINI